MRTSFDEWYYSRTPHLRSRIVHGNTVRILAEIMTARQDMMPPPTIRELCALTGTVKNNVHKHLCRLEKLGLVARQVNKARALVPTCRFIPAEQLE